MRLYCPNDTTILSRLAFSGAQSTASAQNSHSLIVWTAPTTNTYYLRMVPVTVSATNGGYRIQTGTHIPVGSDVARDTRDVVMSSSADGVTGWSPRLRVNDDGPFYDNWLPEVAVPCDGNPYIMWFDWRDTPASCFGGSNIYLTRSTDGGASWAANQVATTAVTANWTQVASNIAPNQGDYNGMYGGDAVGLAWADGRLGDADVFAARIPATFTLAGCPSSQNVLANTSTGFGAVVGNPNQMFSNDYSWTVTVDKSWPGYPLTGSGTLPANGSTPVSYFVSVPDTAADGEIAHFCFTVNCTGGACAQTCCYDLTVINAGTGALASLASATVVDGSVRLAWSVSADAATVDRSEDGNVWTSLGAAAVDGTRLATFTDATVQAGKRYAYRLSFVRAGAMVHDGQAWVEVPAGMAQFALRGAQPNPATTGFLVTFSLPAASPARLEVLDLSGRRIVQREVGSFGIGTHTVSLERETSGLPAGIYGLRLVQNGRVATSKVTIVR
jgi:hypothetical protein